MDGHESNLWKMGFCHLLRLYRGNSIKFTTGFTTTTLAPFQVISIWAKLILPASLSGPTIEPHPQPNVMGTLLQRPVSTVMLTTWRFIGVDLGPVATHLPTKRRYTIGVDCTLF